MTLQEHIRERLQPIYFLGQNFITLTGAVLTTSTALTTIAFWFYEVFLPGIFVLGLLLIPLGIWLRRRSLTASGTLPSVFPAIDLGLPLVRRTLEY
ncbi:MAG: cytochrome C, partial [Terriglobales bacterium]